MKIEAGNFCPFIQKDCIGLQCKMMTQLRGVDSNTGQEVDAWDCTLKWLPMLLVENSQQQRGTGAAVESFRNEMVKANKINQHILLSGIERGGPTLTGIAAKGD